MEQDRELLCYCVPTTREELLQAMEKYKLKTLEEIQKVTGVCTGCQSCYPDVLEILAEYWGRKQP